MHDRYQILSVLAPDPVPVRQQLPLDRHRVDSPRGRSLEKLVTQP